MPPRLATAASSYIATLIACYLSNIAEGVALGAHEISALPRPSGLLSLASTQEDSDTEPMKTSQLPSPDSTADSSMLSHKDSLEFSRSSTPRSLLLEATLDGAPEKQLPLAWGTQAAVPLGFFGDSKVSSKLLCGSHAKAADGSLSTVLEGVSHEEGSALEPSTLVHLHPDLFRPDPALLASGSYLKSELNSIRPHSAAFVTMRRTYPVPLVESHRDVSLHVYFSPSATSANRHRILFERFVSPGSADKPRLSALAFYASSVLSRSYDKPYGSMYDKFNAEVAWLLGHGGANGGALPNVVYVLHTEERDSQAQVLEEAVRAASVFRFRRGSKKSQGFRYMYKFMANVLLPDPQIASGKSFVAGSSEGARRTASFDGSTATPEIPKSTAEFDPFVSVYIRVHTQTS